MSQTLWLFTDDELAQMLARAERNRSAARAAGLESLASEIAEHCVAIQEEVAKRRVGCVAA